MVNIKDYESTAENKWCPGCGNFGILAAMKSALVKLKITPEKVLIISGIGQAANTPHYLKCNMFHSLHGRALPLATGAKLANHDLTVLVNSGDGDCYGEGGNHFLHAIRRNIDITLLVHNNKVYGLTKGQASPTADRGTKTRLQPRGVLSESFNPLTVALSLGAGFVARGSAGDPEHLSGLIQAAIKFKGFSLVDILQPCVSFDPIHTFAWYKKRVYHPDDKGDGPDDVQTAMKLTGQWGDKIPVGILYQKKKASYTDQLDVLTAGPLVARKYAPDALQSLLDGL
ncbi:MAG: 2-oxoacid:ferredoxin oxidoreductase subunit beta [Desulfobacterales bacterium]|nr:2-oxoacid:ferredoxin oxidoreductase subunit beta [Desulfobacterales bacterium]